MCSDTLSLLDALPILVVGMDLSAAHARAARVLASRYAPIVQGDMLNPPFAEGAFDLVWAINAVNHLHEPVAGVRMRSEEHTSELQSHVNLVCRPLPEK